MQDNFLYIDGVSNIESKNIQGLTLIKLSFYQGTDMAEAAAEVAIQVNRCMAFFPAGSLPPEVVRFDASSLPVGELVFSSKTRSLNDIFDMAAVLVRPLFRKSSRAFRTSALRFQRPFSHHQGGPSEAPGIQPFTRGGRASPRQE